MPFWYRHVQYIADAACALMILCSVPREKKQKKPLVALALLILIANNYLFSLLPDTKHIVRVCWLVVFYSVCLIIINKSSLLQCLYVSLFAYNILSICQNIFFTPLLYDLSRLKVVITGNHTADLIICTIIRLLIQFCIFYGVIKVLPENRFTQISRAVWVIIVLITAVAIYTKKILAPMRSAAADSTEQNLSTFIIILQITIIILLIFFERYISSERSRREVAMQEIANQYYIQNLENDEKNRQDLRALHHDMKSHLLAIDKLASESEGSNIHDYIMELMPEMQGFENTVKTGNRPLDGIMSDKLSMAIRLGIDMDIMLNLSEIDFIKDHEISTIFGNVLDNAIEACSALPEGKSRRISVRNELIADQLRIIISNSSANNIELENGLPKTTKKAKEFHGIGLKNVRRTVEKYNGILAIDTSTPEQFSVKILIPIQNNTTESIV